MIYYNEVDKHAAAWLKRLQDAGLIPRGDIDERDIRDVSPSDLAGYKQCHFFAGIGGWPLAMQLAGWPDDREIWTGSCPCQPFSSAGKGQGFDDERHLWPDWNWLISQRRPSAVVGEQVDGPAARAWLDLVSSDLEHTGYAFGAAILPAACVGAAHARHRHFWVAHHDGPRRQQRREAAQAVGYGTATRPSRGAGGVADLRGPGLPERISHSRVRSNPMGSPEGQAAFGSGDPECLADEQGDRQHRRPGNQSEGASVKPKRRGAAGGVDHPSSIGRDQGRNDNVEHVWQFADPAGQIGWLCGPASTDHGEWAAADWIRCRDGLWRPVEPGTQPLAYGIPGRVGLLRGYGNAIDPRVGAVFLSAVMETLECRIQP